MKLNSRDLKIVKRAYLDALVWMKDGSKLLVNKRKKPFKVYWKDNASPVCDLDLMMDDFFRKKFKKNYPSFGFLGEESKALESDSEFTWCLDPIDGTSNFIGGNPYYGISLSLLWKEKPFFGVVAAPEYQTIYHAFKGRGAFENKKRLLLKTRRKIDHKPLLALAVSGSTEKDYSYFYSLKRNWDLRILGSAALELCDVAKGHLDLAYQKNLSSWDWSAGALIVTEAGGRVCTIQEKEWSIDSKSLLAGSFQSLKKIL